MSICTLERTDKGLWQCSVCGWTYPHQTDKPPRRTCPEPPPYTTGDILHDLLAEKLGVGLKEGCACKAWISQMNVWGPTGSREHLVGIVNALLAEAKRREWKLEGKPILSKVAGIGTTLPGGMIFARAWTRRLVNEAITRSERHEEDKMELRSHNGSGENP